jgi:hypothetical protein
MRLGQSKGARKCVHQVVNDRLMNVTGLETRAYRLGRLFGQAAGWLGLNLVRIAHANFLGNFDAGG